MSHKPGHIDPTDPKVTLRKMKSDNTRHIQAERNIRDSQFSTEQALDLQNAQASLFGGEQFEEKYGKSIHAHRYETDPVYKNQIDKSQKEHIARGGATLDFSKGDVRRDDFRGSPNARFMNPTQLQGDAARANEEFHSEIISATLPLGPTAGTISKAIQKSKALNSIKKSVDLQKRFDKAMSKYQSLGLDFSKPPEIPMQMRHSVPETSKIKNATFDNFLERVNSPEGKERATVLGIRNPELLNNIKLRKTTKEFGFFNRGNNYLPGTQGHNLKDAVIVTNPKVNRKLGRQVIRHELEHGVQTVTHMNLYNNGVRMGNKVRPGPLDARTLIDKKLEKLTLDTSKAFSQETVKRGLLSKSGHNRRTLNDLFKDDAGAINYFREFQGAPRPSEKAAFLAEAQEYMVNKGIIKHAYQKITSADVAKAVKKNKGDRGNQLRIFRITQPTEKNYEIMADALNHMLTPAAVTATGAVTKTKFSKDRKKK
jgi:hypothetical protein